MGLAAAHSAQLLGAAVVIVGDQIVEILGVPKGAARKYLIDPHGMVHR